MIRFKHIVVTAGALICLTAVRPSVAQDVPATHTVQAGETLYAIARRYGLSVAELQRLNALEGEGIRTGQVLRLLPRKSPSPEAPTPGEAVRGPSRRPVEGNRSIVDVALRLGVPVDSLLAANPDLPVSFEAGDSILVPARYATQTVRVRRGDTLYGLASRYGTTVGAIRSLNRLRSDVLSVGQRLEVPSGNVLPEDVGLPPVTAEGPILEYPALFAGRLTASGRPYDPLSFVVAHPSLELGTVVLLSVASSGRSAFAEVADRMPARADHLVEVSTAVARALGQPDGDVILRVIDRPGGGGRP